MISKAGKTIKSQALLDFIIVFGILIAFLVGLIHIWVWFNANYAKRNVDYQWTREKAGQANDGTHGSIEGIYDDEILPINDDWVFRGNYTGGKIRLPPNTGLGADSQDGVDAEAQACATARIAAANFRSQATDYENQAASLNLNCDDDDDACESEQNNAIITLRQQAIEARDNADTVESNACS